MAVADDQLHRTRHVTQRVDDLVDHPEAATSKLLLDDELVSQPIASRKVEIVRLIVYHLCRSRHRRGWFCLGRSLHRRLQQGIQACQSGGRGWALVLIK